MTNRFLADHAPARIMHSTTMRVRHALSAVLLPLALAACATTGATYGSGVGDAFLDRPPFYAGRTVTPGAAPIVRLPVAYQPGASQGAAFDPSGAEGTPMAALLREMNLWLDSLGAGAGIARVEVSRGTPPDVRFGCETDAAGDCEGRDETRALGRQPERMRLAVGRPSAEWAAAAGEAMAAAGADRAIVVTIETGQYFVRQTGLRGDKSVELGTGYTVSLPWLTSLETPVSVVQLTGALVDRDGRAVRIGAEGVMARRTRFLASALGAQALIGDDDVERLRTLRREDLPGRPLAWQAALGHLLTQLTGRPEIVAR